MNLTQFGYESTAAEVLAGHDLSGMTALVTGGTSGIGTETARALAAAGARVVITARDKAKAEEALDRLHQLASNAAFEYALVDLGSLDSVRQASADILERFPVINILINNAGVMATPFGRTVDGFETQFGTNHLGHFLLTNLLARALIAGAPSRVISLSSASHQRGDVQWEDINFETQPYETVSAYAQSKTANVLFAVELERRLRAHGVHAYAVHPGVIPTNIRRHLPPEMLEMLKAHAASNPSMEKTIEQGAASTVWAATSADREGKGGSYIQDCSVAVPGEAEGSAVMAYALDPEAALRLWLISEQMVGQTFPPVRRARCEGIPGDHPPRRAAEIREYEVPRT
jgi:NAD(P)-dependent dehydrogenase (short-subunit alcohol dehydrogenase family)